MIRLLAAVLEQAVEYDHIPRNPAAGCKRLLRESKPSRSYLQPDQVAALLSAAGGLDAEGRDTGRRRPLLATPALAGLRISELLDLRWRDVHLRPRFLARAVERANAALAEEGGEPIDKLTPHGLRRTFISLLLAAGADVPYVMAQAPHSDPKQTLGIYASVIASGTDHGATMDELVHKDVWGTKRH